MFKFLLKLSCNFIWQNIFIAGAVIWRKKNNKYSHNVVICAIFFDNFLFIEKINICV